MVGSFEESYFDEYDKPIELANGQTKEVTHYNEKGAKTKIIHYDKDGEIVGESEIIKPPDD